MGYDVIGVRYEHARLAVCFLACCDGVELLMVQHHQPPRATGDEEIVIGLTT